MQVEYSGLLGVAKDDGEPGSEMIGLAIAIVVLAIAFGSLVAMSLPIGVALIGLFVGSSAIGILAGYVAVPSITTIVATMLGLGVGIDYALFILARHRQNLAEGMPVPEAVGRANATAGLSVLFAGVTVVVAIASLQVAGIPMLTTMGWGSALMVAITMVAAVTLLPGLLGLVGRKVNSLRVPFVRPKPANALDTRSAGGQLGSSPARSATPWSHRPARRARRAGVRAADRLRGRRQRDAGQHAAQVLRPGRRRLRPRLQRAGPGRRRGRRLGGRQGGAARHRHGAGSRPWCRVGRRTGVEPGR